MCVCVYLFMYSHSLAQVKSCSQRTLINQHAVWCRVQFESNRVCHTIFLCAALHLKRVAGNRLPARVCSCHRKLISQIGYV